MIRSGWMQGVAGHPNTRGFLWGAGTAIGAYFLFPAVREAMHPASRGVIRSAAVAGERFRHAVAEAREGLEGLVVESYVDRMRNRLADRVENAAESVAGVLRPNDNKPTTDN